MKWYYWLIITIAIILIILFVISVIGSNTFGGCHDNELKRAYDLLSKKLVQNETCFHASPNAVNFDSNNNVFLDCTSKKQFVISDSQAGYSGEYNPIYKFAEICKAIVTKDDLSKYNCDINQDYSNKCLYIIYDYK